MRAVVHLNEADTEIVEFNGDKVEIALVGAVADSSYYEIKVGGRVEGIFPYRLVKFIRTYYTQEKDNA